MLQILSQLSKPTTSTAKIYSAVEENPVYTLKHYGFGMDVKYESLYDSWSKCGHKSR